VIIPVNEVQGISEALKTTHVGGITVLKVKGRGKTLPPEIHASLGTEIFRPEFGDKYALQVIVSDNKENDVKRLLEQILKWERSLFHQLHAQLISSLVLRTKRQSRQSIIPRIKQVSNVFISEAV
jgi:nitrogen regulatory protein P-II 1